MSRLTRLLLDVQSFTRELLIQICHTKCDNSNYSSGMLLILRNILCIKVALSMLDFIVIEIIALDVIRYEAKSRNTFYCKY